MSCKEPITELTLWMLHVELTSMVGLTLSSNECVENKQLDHPI